MQKHRQGAVLAGCSIDRVQQPGVRYRDGATAQGAIPVQCHGCGGQQQRAAAPVGRSGAGWNVVPCRVAGREVAAGGQVMREVSCERGRAGLGWGRNRTRRNRTGALCPADSSDGGGDAERAGFGLGAGTALRGPGERAGAHAPHGLAGLGEVPLQRGLPGGPPQLYQVSGREGRGEPLPPPGTPPRRGLTRHLPPHPHPPPPRRGSPSPLLCKDGLSCVSLPRGNLLGNARLVSGVCPGRVQGAMSERERVGLVEHPSQHGCGTVCIPGASPTAARSQGEQCVGGGGLWGGDGEPPVLKDVAGLCSVLEKRFLSVRSMNRRGFKRQPWRPPIWPRPALW